MEMLFLYDINRHWEEEKLLDLAAVCAVSAVGAMVEASVNQQHAARKGRSPNIDHRHHEGFHNIYREYFAEIHFILMPHFHITLEWTQILS